MRNKKSLLNKLLIIFISLILLTFIISIVIHTVFFKVKILNAVKYFFTKTTTLYIFITLIFTNILFILIKNKIKKKKTTKFEIDKIDKMSGGEFEDFLEVLFNNKGYKVQNMPLSGDFGADLVVQKHNDKIAIQAKRYSNKVGLHAIQEVIGSMAYYNCNKGMVITNSYFTKSARKLAKVNNIILWNRDRFIKEVLLSF